MTMKVVRSALILLVFSTLALAAQNPTAVVEYFDNELEIQVFDPDGFELQFLSFGEELEQGSRIITQNSSVELRLVPNGSIVRVAPDSEMRIDLLEGSRTVELSLPQGRLRHVAARVGGARYRVETQAVVAGVRGTDYSITQNSVTVFSGSVDVEDLITGTLLALSAGQRADVSAESFQPQQLTEQELSDAIDEDGFQQLDPQAVDEGVADADEGDEPEADDDPESDDDEEVDEPVDPVEADLDDPEQPTTAADTTEPTVFPSIVTPSMGSADPGTPRDEGALGDMLGTVGQHLGMEIGSVTIDGQTYSKAVLQPSFQLGNFRLGFYLPVIYRSNLFDPDDWHRPRGNDEWSFGTDEHFSGRDDEVWARTEDALRDIGLKIRFLEYGEQRDRFFFKVGNIESMTLGHGLLMRNYANDSDFPAVRRLGLNLGIDTGGSGLEFVTNDLTEGAIYGTRLFVRPLGESVPFAVGVSALTDISPASELPQLTDLEDADAPIDLQRARQIDPVFLNVAADIDIPILENDFLSIILFGDVGGLVPYLREPLRSTDDSEVVQPAGFVPETLFYQTDDGRLALRNYGIMTGVFGNIAGLDYRLDARNSNGMFRPSFYGQNYDRIRGDRAAELAAYLLNPEDERYDSSTYGIYGEAGATILGAVRLEAGYLWPWTRDSSNNLVAADKDELSLLLAVEPGTLPFGVYGNVSYRRTEFAPTLLGRDGFADTHLFDANTVFRGEVVYPVAPILNLVGTVTTTVARDPDGTIRYDENGRPEWAPSFTIETRIGM